MPKSLSRRELQTQVEALKQDLAYAAALLYKHDRLISVLLISHPNYTTDWLYTPSSVVSSKHRLDVPLAVRKAPASSAAVPSLKKMADHVMVTDLLVP